MFLNDFITYVIAPAILALYCFFASEFCFTEKREEKTRKLFHLFGITCIILEIIGIGIIILNCLQ
jgi:hypothetical protein